ncbi:inner nuclear membrane protein enriched at telomere/subtelomere region [Emydomyces testavorans]|uniref:Inner nuclear membrane protein enriched at telomere/subtelomere region n=1 Tax=Emydomyces testavorans TaxID=2070801 RepID=A0AAF0DGY4_9EURO|nr:inner nuclear membrane protein enriched at telomere/subtelomere region [Emydomyces testavorans]
MAHHDSGDELAYLTPGFDLNSLTVPRLRSILVSHDVSYPTSAKKGQLIGIVESEVLPKAKQLLRQRDRIQRTSEGIIDMPSSQESVEEDDEETRVRRRVRPPPAPPSTRKTRSRPTTRASTTEIDDASATPSTSRRKTTRSTVKHPRASDTEESREEVHGVEATPKATGRKLRKSEAYPTPQGSVPPAQETPVLVKHEDRGDSVFTDDNPFQSGSPIETPPVRSVSSELRRKSIPRHSTAATTALDGKRKRKTETPLSTKIKQEDGIVVPTRSTFEIPVAGLKSLKAEEPEGDLVPGEEFTPDEQLALTQEQATPQKAVVRRKPSKQGGSTQIASWLVILTLLSGIGLWWRKEKIEIGYCGVGKPHWSLEDTKIPQWASIVEPKCEPCPQHAFCYPDFEASCEQDFVLKPHPLSLGGLIPLPPTCEPDSDKLRRVKVVTDKAVDELRERRAKYECGEADKDGSKEVTSPEMTASELKQRVSKSKRKGMSDEEFEELWRGALGEITGREEVVTSTKGPTSAPIITFSSSSLAKLSLACAVKRHLRLSLLAYRLPILLLALGASTIAYARSQILAKRSDAARVPFLVSMTLDRLATQAALHARGDALEPWISVGQLRDDVLREELRKSRREELWNQVKRIVEGNANVRASVREGRGGDVSRVWEWIGGIKPIGGDLESPSLNRLDGSRVRLSLLPTETEGVGEQTFGNREMKKWDEGRPVY